MTNKITKAEADWRAELTPEQYHVLDEPAWTAFLAALDRPPRKLPRLRRLLTTPSVLDEA